MQQYEQAKYFAKKKFFKLFGGEIRIYDESQNNLLFFIKQKAFKLKEDITVYADESKNQELMKIQARSIIDFSAAYDITDLTSGEKIGALRRKGLKSIIRDSWEILDPSDNVIGSVTEDSMAMALMRRFLSNLIPQTLNIEKDGKLIGELKQTFNPFVPQFKVDFSMDTDKVLDRRMGIGTVILMQIIEGRQG